MGSFRQRDRCEGREKTKDCGNAPNYFEQAELQTVGPLLAHAEIGEDEEASVSVVILRVLEVIE